MNFKIQAIMYLFVSCAPVVQHSQHYNKPKSQYPLSKSVSPAPRSPSQSACFVRANDLAQGLARDLQHLKQEGGWSIFYNNHHLNPDLVIYSMLFNPEVYKLTRKTFRTKFKTDARVEQKANNKHYAKSPYDKGHMVPAKDMSFSKEAAVSTFMLSNIAPQTKKLNRYVWKDYEQHIRTWSCAHDRKVQVLVGPIYNKASSELRRLKNNQQAPSIPDAFFKIVLAEGPGQSECHGLVVIEDNHKPNKEMFQDIVSVSKFQREYDFWFEDFLPSHATFSAKYWQEVGDGCRNVRE